MQTRRLMDGRGNTPWCQCTDQETLANTVSTVGMSHAGHGQDRAQAQMRCDGDVPSAAQAQVWHTTIAAHSRALDFSHRSRFIRGHQSMTYRSVNPCDGALGTAYPKRSSLPLEDAILKAHECCDSWRKTTVSTRADVVEKAVHILHEKFDESARPVTKELGAQIAQFRDPEVRERETGPSSIDR